MRVLQVIPTLAVGGAERVVSLLARHLRRSGHDVAVISLYDPSGSWIEAGLRSDGIPVEFLGKRPGLDLRMIPRIARVVARFRPDVVHTPLYVLKYVLPAAAGRCRVVHTVHNLAEHEVERLSKVLQAIAFRAGVIPVAIGDAVAESMQKLYRLPARHLIPNGIPVSDYAPPAGAREEVRASLGIPGDAPVFVAVGRLERQKNGQSLIEAFASERLRSLGARLLLAGDGELRHQLEAQASARGVRDRVHFLGIRADIPRVLAAADVFVLASRYEGNPLTVMEAMAAGKPVLATAVGCVPELVPDSAGLLVAPGDDAALEAAMVDLAADAGRAREKGASAALVARSRFDASVMASAYEKLYAEVT